jgi:hypothetical protein
MEFDDIQPTQIAFHGKVFSSKLSVVFLVNIRNQTCIMKVVRRTDTRFASHGIANTRSITGGDRDDTMSQKTENWTFMCWNPLPTFA